VDCDNDIMVSNSSKSMIQSNNDLSIDFVKSELSQCGENGLCEMKRD
jgi:hypothetical protein